MSLVVVVVVVDDLTTALHTIMAVDRTLAVRAVAAVFFSLASVTIILRCYVRLAIVKAFGWDDAMMLLAMVGPQPSPLEGGISGWLIDNDDRSSMPCYPDV